MPTLNGRKDPAPHPGVDLATLRFARPTPTKSPSTDSRLAGFPESSPQQIAPDTPATSGVLAASLLRAPGPWNHVIGSASVVGRVSAVQNVGNPLTNGPGSRSTAGNTMVGERLRWALQALAAEPQAQLALFPDFVVKADELALSFDEAHRECSPLLTAPERAHLAPLDEHLKRMSSCERPELWTDHAIMSDALWGRTRELAQEILIAFGVPDALPPFALGAMYVEGARR